MCNLPIVVNLFGAPGSGKSTLDKVWEENKTALCNQVYVFAKQYYRLGRCAGKVDVVITDSPLALSPFYNKDPDIHEPLKQLAYKISQKYSNLNYFLRRIKQYNPVGRLETEQESDQKAVGLKKMLQEYQIPYKDIDGDLMSADIVVNDICKLLEDREKLEYKERKAE